MGLLDMRKRLSTSVEQLEETRLQTRCAGLALTSIGEVPERAPVRVGGEVQSMQFTRSAGVPSFEVSISDGTGRAVAKFVGRGRVAGFGPGTVVLLEGVGRRTGSRLVFLNPAYTLLPG